MRQLTDRGVTRLEHLEVLLILSRQPERGWDAESIRSVSTISLTTAGDALAHLHKQGLVEPAPGKPSCMRLTERADVALLTQLRKDHERDRTAVTNAFFACNLESLRSFASAFRIRRPQG